MRIVCPACAAAYDVPDDRLTTGRVVRCARCDTDWVPLTALEPEAADIDVPVSPAEAQSEPELDDGKEPEAAADRPAPSVSIVAEPRFVTPERSGGWALRLAWIGSVVVVMLALASATIGRERVMQAWPPSIRAYDALGLGRTSPK